MYAIKTPVKRGRGRPINSERREEIIAMAARLFGELGLKATTMEQIAKALGMSKLTLYSRFASKEELFIAVIKSKCQQHIPEDFFIQFEQLDTEESLFKIASALLGLLTSEEELNMERMLMSLEDKYRTDLTTLFYEAGPVQLKNNLAKHLGNLHLGNKLCVPEPELSANLFAAMIKGSDIVLRASLGIVPSATQVQIESYCQAVVQAFMEAHKVNKS